MIWEYKHAVLLSFQRLMMFILHIIMYSLAMFFLFFPDGKISMCFALCFVKRDFGDGDCKAAGCIVMSQDMCFTSMSSLPFFSFSLFSWRALSLIFNRFLMLSCGTCGTLQRYSNISKIWLCKVFEWCLLFCNTCFENYFEYRNKTKKREVVEGKQAEQKVFQTHRVFVSHRVPCQLLLPGFTRPPLTLPLPTVHLFPYASLSLSGHALFLTLLLSPKDQSGFWFPLMVFPDWRNNPFLEGWINLSVGTKMWACRFQRKRKLKNFNTLLILIPFEEFQTWINCDRLAVKCSLCKYCALSYFANLLCVNKHASRRD